jgi:hypothetical protein
MDESDELFFKTEKYHLRMHAYNVCQNEFSTGKDVLIHKEEKKANIAVVPYLGVKNSV